MQKKERQIENICLLPSLIIPCISSIVSHIQNLKNTFPYPVES